ncbi:MAG: hypothetical protein MUE69_24755 [Myxococcota bacterium]|nr:hypothetical protein [Myxococcota bacterium]
MRTASAHAGFAAVDGADREAEELEGDLVARGLGDAVHAQARGELVVGFDLAAFDEVSEAVVDVVHAHERGGGLRVVGGGLADLAGGVGHHGVGEHVLTDRVGARERDAPAHVLVELGVREHGLEVELEVLGGLGELLAERVDVLHGGS